LTVAHARHWTTRHTLMLAVLLAACAGAFHGPISGTLSMALSDPDQSHIILAPFVALWLIWLRRSRLEFIRAHPALAGPVLVGLGVAASIWGYERDLHTAWHAGPIIALVGMIVSVCGWRPLRLFAPSFLVLAFLLPVPATLRQAISLPLQSMAATVSQAMLEAFGAQATRLGNVLVVNGEQVVLAEACSGMRLVFSLALVTFAFAFSLALRPSTRMLIILISPLIAIAANVVRLIPTSFLYGHVSAERAMLFHDISGWMMLPLALLALAALLRLLRWLEFPVTSYKLASS
jgi:exosortase